MATCRLGKCILPTIFVLLECFSASMPPRRQHQTVIHPVDYIVFNGMKTGQIKNLILMDKSKRTADKRLQQSIQKVIEKKNYEWITLRVEENGNIKQE
jgi:predicted Holliday junction resolvase-like endonuclease